MGWLSGVLAEAREIVRPQCLAHPGEHVHHVVGVRGVMADRGEDEPAVALDEGIPGSVGVPGLEPGYPGFHGGGSRGRI